MIGLVEMLKQFGDSDDAEELDPRLQVQKVLVKLLADGSLGEEADKLLQKMSFNTEEIIQLNRISELLQRLSKSDTKGKAEALEKMAGMGRHGAIFIDDVESA